MKILKNLFLICFVLGFTNSHAQILDKSWKNIVDKSSDEWFATDQAKEVAENVLLYQKNIGGWHKNIQMQKPLSDEEKKELIASKDNSMRCTTDNGATILEMKFLSKMYAQVPDERYKEAFLSGLNYLLEAQYDNGGWPQYYPLRKGYYTHITYNDDSMVNILELLKHLIDETEYYSIKPSDEVLFSAKKAFDKGIDCIINTQYKQNGILTAWCAQHDENTLLPAKARAYELPSLSGSESAKIVLLLMKIDNPSDAVKKTINSAVVWFEKVKLEGVKEVRSYSEKGKITNKEIVKDSTAPPMWGRFMELDDNRVFFSDRDGIKKYSLSEIGAERRNGYGWYTDKPKEVFKKYKKWTKKYGTLKTVQTKKSKPKNSYNVTVAKDGSGDYTTIQEAIYGSKSFPYQRVIINIKNGVYNEKVHVYSWNTHVSFLGESKEGVVITNGDYFKKIDVGRNSTFHTSTVLVEGNDFYAENLTIENSAGNVGQAVALTVNANRVLFNNCKLLGNQDTLYLTGEGFKQYFKNCYIDGTTDFIFGEATAVFQDCVINSKSNSYITAASTPKGQEFGFVFKNCDLTAEEKTTEVYLGRPWRMYAKTVFLDCNMDNHIKPVGWHNWNKTDAESTTFYAEYNSVGEGANIEKRVSWSHQLKKSQAKKYTLKNILGESNKVEWYEKF